MPGSYSSSASGGSDSVNKGPEAGGRGSGEDADDNLVGNAFEKGLMGMLYTVGKEKKYTLPFVIFRLLIDLVQLLLLSMNPQYGFNIDPSNGAWKVFSFLQLNAFLSARGYNFFLGCMYIMAAGLVLNVGLCIWVSKAFAENRFDHVWPIVWLRWYSLVFYQVLDIASMSLFLMTMDCQYYWVDPAVQFTHQEFGVACFTMPHLVHVAVATIALITFAILATPFTMAEIDLNPTSKNALGMGHTKVEGISFVLKFVMTSATVFINSPRWLSIILTFLSAYLLYLYLKWEPHANSIVNQIRVASYSMVLYSALMLVAVAFPPSSVDQDDPDQLSAYQAQVTGALWGGLVPAGLLGWLGSWLRLRYFLKTVAGRFEAASEETPSTHIHKFSDPREVEVASRVLRVWVDEDTLDQGRVALAERIMRAGKSQLGSSPYMSILWSSFLMDVQGSYQSGYLALQNAKKAPNPSFLERFCIFIREQEHMQKSTAMTAGDSGNIDLVSYVEFQRNLNMVIRLHTEALLAKRAFWVALESHRLARFDKLAAAVARIEASVKSAERMYRTVLARHSNSVKILQLYVKFLQGVKGDPWTAARWAAEAEKLQRIEEETNEKAVMGGRSNSMDSHDESKAVIIIGANCLIRMANDTAAAMLGYETKQRMLGHNVNVLVPPPFAKMHNQYVRSYIATGQAKILGSMNEFVAVHRDRYVVPVRLQISHVSGIGEDSVFMGVMQALPQKEGVATLWVLSSGAIVACDATFTDWLGFKQGDLHMRSFVDLVVEREEIERIMLSVRDSHAPPALPEAHSSNGLRMVASGHGSMAIRVPIAEGVEEDDNGASGLLSSQKRSKKKSNRVEADPSGSPSAADVDNLFAELSLAEGVSSHQNSHGGSNVAPQPPSLPPHGPAGPRLRTPPSSHTPRALLAGEDDSALGSHDSRRIEALDDLTAAKAPVLNANSSALGSIKLPMSSPAQRGPTVSKRQSTMGSKASTGDASVTAEGLHLRHNYKDSTVKVAMQVRASVFGDRCFYIVTLTRSEVEDGLTLVTDNRGHVVHATQALATRLGTSVSALYSGGAAHALDALLPAPFTRVHHLWYKDAAQTAAGTAGEVAPPPHSCRSGLPVCLPAVSAMGLPEQQVYSLNFRLRTVGPLDSLAVKGAGGNPTAGAFAPPAAVGPQLARTMNDALHVVTLTPSTMEAALDARRLRLVVSMEDATVLSTSPSPDALFGFDPKSLVGSSLAYAVDVLRPRTSLGEALGKSHLTDAEKAAGRLLRMLAERNRSSPGASWRVGVSPSIDPVEVAALGGVGEDMVAAATKAAVMTVRFKVEAPTLAGSTLILPKVVELEVELWRSDLMTAVLEVDNHGNVVATGMPGIPFYEPHLMFGIPSSRVSAAHLSSLLPVRSGVPAIAALFAEGGLVSVASGAPAAAKQKGSALKGKTAKGAIGPVHAVRLMHAGDGRELEIKVTAVVRGTPGMMSGGAYVLLRFGGTPTCGRYDLAAYLDSAAALHRPPVAAMGPSGRPRQNSYPLLMQDSGYGTPVRQMSHALHGAPAPPPTAAAGPLPFRNQPSLRQSSSRSGEARGQIDPTADPLLAAVDSPLLVKPSVNFASDDGRGAGQGGVNGLAAIGESDSPTNAPASPALGGKHTDKNSAVTAWLMSNSSQATPQVGPHHHGDDNHRHGLSPLGHASLAVPEDSNEPPGYHMMMMVPQMTLEEEQLGGEGDDDGGSGHGENEQDPATHPAEQEGLEQEHLIDQEADAGAMAAYKRGKRYRRLCKMLTSKEMQAYVNRLRHAAYIVIAIMLAIEVASFTSYYVQLLAQNTQIDYMFGTARAANEALSIVQDVAAMKALLLGQGVPGLRYLQNSTYNSSDYNRIVGLMSNSITQVTIHHQGLYHGYDNASLTGTRMPQTYGLRDLWETPCLNFSQWYTDKLNAAYQPLPIYSNLSLWEGGNLFIASARNLWANGLKLNTTGPTPFSNLTDTFFIIRNGASALNLGYRQSAVGLLSITLDKSKQLNLVQEIMLIFEGAFAMIIALAVITYYSQALAHRRQSVYTVFVRVPIGVIHGLAAAPLGLGEEDGEEDEEEEGQQQGNDPHVEDLEALTNSAGRRRVGNGALEGSLAIGDGKSGAHNNNSGALSPKGRRGATTEPSAAGGPARATTPPQKGFFGTLASWLAPASTDVSVKGKAGLYGGRSLVKSYKDTILLVWPFVMWGAVVVALNSTGVMTLVDMEGAIANLNIVAGVFQSVNLCNVFALEMAQAYPNVTSQTYYRGQLQLNLDYLKEVYRVQLYGNAEGNATITDDLTGGHTTQGIAFQGEGFQILYGNSWGNNGCLAFNAADCLNSSAAFYPYTSNGLDVMLEKYIHEVENLLSTPLSNASLANPSFKYIWEVGFVDLVNGCRRNSLSYVTFVHSLYNSTLLLHAVSLGFSIGIAALYLLFIFRPFVKKTNSEPRRVAELLSCLPPELDVEGMVKGVVVTANKDNGDGKSGEVSRSAASGSSMNRSWHSATMARGGGV